MFGRATFENWPTSSSTPPFYATKDRLPPRTCLRISIAVNSPGAAATHPGPISLRDLEMQAIFQALERNGGSKPKAADELGISLKTLYNKLNQASDLEKSA